MTRRWFAPLALMLACLPFALSSLMLPFGRDQGIYAHTADQFLEGHALYRDVYTFKPFMTVFVHVASQLLFGQCMTAIRLFDVLWTLATVAAIYLFVRSAFTRESQESQDAAGESSDVLGSRLVAVAAGVFYAFAYHRYDFWMSAQTDGWANLPVAAALWLAIVRSKRVWAPRITAGIAMGAAFWFKYTFAAFLPLAMLLPFARGWRRGLTEAAFVAAGFAGAVLAGVGWLWWAGSLDAFLAIQRSVVFDYSGMGRPEGTLAHLRLFWEQLHVPAGIVWAAGLGAVWAAVEALLLGRRWLKERTAEVTTRTVEVKAGVAQVVVLAWLAGGFASTYTQGKFFQYHYLGLIPPLAIFAAQTFGRLIRQFKGARRQATLGAAVLGGLVVVLATTPLYRARAHLLFDVATGVGTLDEHWRSGFYANPDFSLRDDLALADWLRENTEPSETVFLWGYEPMVYFLAGREPVSRFPYVLPIVVPWIDEKHDEELLAALQAAPPAHFVIARGDATPWVNGRPEDSLGMFQTVDSIRDHVTSHYRPKGRLARFLIFEHRQRNLEAVIP